MANPISLLIIKSSSASLVDAEAYVRNRGMSVQSLTDMREALEYIVKHRPQYVLVACDHPHKKVKALPKLLAQSLSVTVVMIAESATPSAILTLQSLNHPHLIFPPVTGAAIERTLLKLRKNELEAAKEQERQKIMASYAGTNEKSRAGYFVARGNAGEQMKAVQAATAATLGPERDRLGETFGEWESRTRTTRPLEPNVPRAGQNEADYATKRSTLMESEHPLRTEKKTVVYHGGGTAPKADRPPSLMVRGAIEALDGAVEFDDRVDLDAVARVSVATNVACITVESPRFSGYLVAAMGKNRKIDPAFIDTVKLRLFNFLRANGEAPQNEDTLGITIREVEFEAWAIAHAEFLRKTIYGADEVAMAFFPHAPASRRLEPSADESMVKISLDELRDDVPLEFDVYIHMPKNNRYVLYSPQGRKLPGAQKIRLREKGVSHMHLRKEAIRDVKRYRAQNYLNSRIEEFQKIGATAA